MNHMLVGSEEDGWYKGNPRDSLFFAPDLDECQECGSYNTFTTFDKKLVCRNCWTVEDI